MIDRATPKLVVINGPPAAGKSTIAMLYAEHHPMTLRLDVDEIRDLISGWNSNPIAAGNAARMMVVEMARHHLGLGYSVVVSQLYGRPAALELLESLAAEADATFVEIILMARRDEARGRFTSRAGPKLEAITSADGSLPKFDDLYDRVEQIVRTRLGAIVINSVDDDIAATYASVIAAVGD